MVGIQRYLEMIGVTQEEIIAFGDGHNDAEMLRFAGIGVAMGNAEDDTKAVADFVTADIDDDGIYKALKHFELI
jgi:hydroxymethylpyrimidine pyrophosphatase-like HAD family hydrolase